MVNDRRPTIEQVVQRKLCAGCGVCAGVCPHNALSMTIDKGRGSYVPALQTDRCTRCGLCYDVCPGHGVDFEAFNDALFGATNEHIAVGRYLASYIGHATDKDLRYDSSSGGLVTALLVFALEEGLIDGALVTRMQRDRPLRPESFIARTPEEVLSAMGSKYCPVAAGTALKEILESEGRYAVVGLPCHIQGIRKAEQRIAALRERIRYRISIACSLDYSFRGTERVLASLGVTPEQVETIQYRGRGWPGSMLIRSKGGKEIRIPLADFYRQLGPYSLRRCTLCSDMLGELSDLSCGDAWVPDVVRTDRVGSSFVISRTPEAEELLEYAASKEAVQLSDLDLPALVASQGHALFKKRKLQARMRLFRLFARSVPTYRQKLMAATRSDYLNTIKLYVARFVLAGNHPILAALFRIARRRKSSVGKAAVRPAAASNRPTRASTDPDGRATILDRQPAAKTQHVQHAENK